MKLRQPTIFFHDHLFGAIDERTEREEVNNQLSESMREMLRVVPPDDYKGAQFGVCKILCVFLAEVNLRDGQRPSLAGLRWHLRSGPDHIRALIAHAHETAYHDFYCNGLRILSRLTHGNPTLLAEAHLLGEKALQIWLKKKDGISISFPSTGDLQ